MPIPVSCPSCSASFKVKDEYAGKRAKCPKCGEPMTIPAVDFEMADDEPAPAKAQTAKPVASKPKPVVVDDEDDAPKPAKKRRTVEEDEDDRPKKKSRSKSEDEDDEKPKGKRKGAKSAEKKGLPLPLLIGVIAGAVVLIGGGITVAVVLAGGGGGQAKATGSPPPITPPGGNVPRTPPTQHDFLRNPRVTSTNASLVKAGMTLAEVMEILGPAEKAGPDEITEVIRQWNPKDTGGIGDRWSGRHAQGFVYRWRNGPYLILVAFSALPTDGGVVEGVMSRFDGIVVEPIPPKAGGTGTPGRTAGTYTGPPPAFDLTAEAFVDDLGPDWKANATKYHGKVMKLTGTAQTLLGENELILRIDADPATKRRASSLPCFLAADQVGTFAFTKNSVVAIVGTVEIADKGQSGFSVTLKDCRPAASGSTPGGTTPNTGTNPTPEGVTYAEHPVVTLTPDELARDAEKYDGKFVVVRGVVERDMPVGSDSYTFALDQEGGRPIYYGLGTGARFPVALKRGQTVELWAQVQANKGEKSISLRDTEMLTPVSEAKVGEVLDAYLADAKAANEKYGGQRWRFTAKVISATFGNVVIEERPGTPKTIVTMGISPGADLRRIRQGDTITFFASPALGVINTPEANVYSLLNCRMAPASLPPGPANPIASQPLEPLDLTKIPAAPVATVTVNDLAMDPAKYAGKWVIVTGKAKFGTELRIVNRKDAVSGFSAVELEQQGPTVRFESSADKFTTATDAFKAKTEVEIWGRVKGATPDGKTVTVEECLSLKPVIEVDAAKLYNVLAGKQDEEKDKYRLRFLKITGTVVMFGGKPHIDAGGLDGAKQRRIDCKDVLTPPGLKLRHGDKVTVFGQAYSVNDGRIELTEGRLLSATR